MSADLFVFSSWDTAELVLSQLTVSEMAMYVHSLFLISSESESVNVLQISSRLKALHIELWISILERTTYSCIVF